jgi:predicted HD phosphohydrolase
MEKVSYQHMADMTEEDTRLIIEDGIDEAKELPDRVLNAVLVLKEFQGPLLVTRYEHSLQSATRAYRDGQSEEYIVAALVHDIGDHFAPYSHGEYVAAVLKPFVSERVCWIIKHHPLFQAYYYAHYAGGDRNARDAFRDHQWYDDCVDFCERFDQNCFETEYDTLPLEFFEPMVRRVFAEPRYAADGMSFLTDAGATAN